MDIKDLEGNVAKLGEIREIAILEAQKAVFRDFSIEEIMLYKGLIFEYIQGYYRWFMKAKSIEEIRMVYLVKGEIK